MKGIINAISISISISINRNFTAWRPQTDYKEKKTAYNRVVSVRGLDNRGGRRLL